jgi:hypothetical protein
MTPNRSGLCNKVLQSGSGAPPPEISAEIPLSEIYADIELGTDQNAATSESESC